MSRRVLRYEVPIDDNPTQLPAGKVVHFSPHRRNFPNRVEVWVETNLKGADLFSPITGPQSVQIYGTGHTIPDGATHLASTLDGPLVWHLYQLQEKP